MAFIKELFAEEEEEEAAQEENRPKWLNQYCMHNDYDPLNVPPTGFVFCKIGSVKSPKSHLTREMVGVQGFGSQVDEYIYSPKGELV